MIPDLPNRPGSYALFLDLPQPMYLEVGRLGGHFFPAGVYAYLGSALGPGGLRGRIGRHLRGGKPHWHVDWLRPVTQPLAVATLSLDGGSTRAPRLECAWSRALAALPGATVPVSRFGASDCHSGCPAHLVWLPAFDAPILDALAGAFPIQLSTMQPLR